MKNSATSVIVAVLMLVAGISLATSSSFAAAQSSSPQTFVAQLSAAPGVSSQATGNATFQLSPDGQSISYKLVVSNINNVFMAHIHLSPSGNIAVWLYPSPNTVSSGDETSCISVLSGGSPSSCTGYKAGKFDGVLAQGNITAADLSGSTACAGCSGLSPLTISALISNIKSGQTFVNVHTVQNPSGEIQGTIVPSGVTSTAPSTVPEFGSFATMILAIAVVGIVAYSARRTITSKL